MTKEVNVYLNAELVGTLKSGAADEMVFSYGQDATRPASVGMPIEQKQFGNLHCEAFIGGLLPEGDEARKVGIRMKVGNLSDVRTHRVLKPEL